jgi:HAD superfamily hydrolase (TIGR01509 family)
MSAASTAEYRRVLDEQLEPVPGVRAAVEAVVARGRHTCVASSGSHDKMRGTLGRTGLRDLFEGRIFSATEVPRGKPAPDLFLHAASRMQVDPGRCVVVEDSRYGVAAARSAGVRVVGFAGGITPEHHLADADVVITDMAVLPGTLDGLLP